MQALLDDDLRRTAVATLGRLLHKRITGYLKQCAGRECVPKLNGFVRRSDEAEAEDDIQKLWTELLADPAPQYARWRTWEGPVSTFLSRRAASGFKDAGRRLRRREKSGAEYRAKVQAARIGRGKLLSDPLRQASAAEELKLFAEAVEAAKADHSSLIVETVRDEMLDRPTGWTIDELAEMHGIHPATVYRRMKRVGEYLRWYLQRFRGDVA